MARVPTEAEIDAMSDDELEAYIAGGDDEALLRGLRDETGEGGAPEAPGWLRRSGAPRSYAWTLIVCSLLGLFACWNLMTAQLSRLREPDASLGCDINPLVSCSGSLETWQGNILGVPNSFPGAMAFASLLTAGALLASGLRPPRWFWWALSLGCVGGMVFVAWFLSISVGAFGSLCPYCMVIWAVTVPVATSTWAWTAAGGHLGLSDEAALMVVRSRWWVTAAVYLLIVLVLLIGLRGQLAVLLT